MLITLFLNELELICLYTIKWFQVLLCNISNSIYQVLLSNLILIMGGVGVVFYCISTMGYSMPNLVYIYIYIYIIKWVGSRRDLYVFRIYLFILLLHMLYFDLRLGQKCHSKVMLRKEVTHSNGSYERKSRGRKLANKMGQAKIPMVHS